MALIWIAITCIVWDFDVNMSRWIAGYSLKDGFYVNRGVPMKRDRLTEACLKWSGTMSISGPFEGRGRQKTAGYVERSKPQFVRNKKGVRSMLIMRRKSSQKHPICWRQSCMLGHIVSGLFLTQITSFFKLNYYLYYIAFYYITFHCITFHYR